MMTKKMMTVVVMCVYCVADFIDTDDICVVVNEMCDPFWQYYYLMMTVIIQLLTIILCVCWYILYVIDIILQWRPKLLMQTFISNNEMILFTYTTPSSIDLLTI